MKVTKALPFLAASLLVDAGMGPFIALFDRRTEKKTEAKPLSAHDLDRIARAAARRERRNRKKEASRE